MIKNCIPFQVVRLWEKNVFLSMKECIPLFSVNRNLKKNNSDPVNWVMGQQAAKQVSAVSASDLLCLGFSFSKVLLWL